MLSKKLALLVLVLVTCFKSFGQDSNFDKGLMAFDAKNFNEALVKLKPYAENGNCLAQFAVGFSLMYNGADSHDSTARHWLKLAAEQKQPNAMGPLAVNYFGSNADQANVNAYLWAMLAAEYDPRQQATTARVLIKSYLSPGELKKAESLIKAYLDKWKETPNCR